MDASDHRKSKENEKERAEKRRLALAAVAVKLDDWFAKLKTSLTESMGLYRARDKLNVIAIATRKLTVKEWKKAIGKTLGVNLLEDYYDGSFYAEAIEKWIQENVDLISTIPEELLGNMRKIVLEGYMNGKPVSAITKEIQRGYSVTRSHARLIARDQMGKLSCQITKHQQQACGVTRYKWSDSGDSRVRRDHRRLNGKIFRWDDPPIVDTRTGRRGHPGQDYQCRCVAIPVFDFSTLDIPIDTDTKGKGMKKI